MSIYPLKRKCVFIVGFIAGFALALLIFSEDDGRGDYRICKRRYPWLCNNGARGMAQKRRKNVEAASVDFSSWMKENGLKTRENVSYETWLKNENVRSVGINMDYRQYGPESEDNMAKKMVLEADWLKSKVHVTCVVFVEKIKRAKSIRDSWGPSCNRLYFFSEHLNDTSLSVLSFPAKLSSSWQMLCESMNYVWTSRTEHNNSSGGSAIEWVIFVKDDTMVIPENLRYLVAPLDFNDGHYLGHPVVLWGQAYNVAQAGFVLSRAAFKKIVKNFDTHQKCASGGRYWKKEDYYLGKHLALFGIHPSDTRDRHLRGLFHGYSLQTLLWGIARPGSYFTRALYPPGHDCCSPRSITFSTSEPDKMYTVNYMLYHLHVYPGPGIFGSGPAPTPVPEEEVWDIFFYDGTLPLAFKERCGTIFLVWRSALREEFNITDFDHVDGDRYYEIWSSRYSGPEQLIRKHNWSFPDARRFLPSDYRSRSMVFN